ncbi:MAG TPA: hypothetical protein VHM89_00945 [Acidimicrobiales bacterium]|nr:hypothetical protein [Acidimicrobiales bacterium]
MRLRAVDGDFALPARLLAAVIRRAGRAEPPDIVKVHLYRPNLFGRWASPAFQDIMRGPSRWTAGERELFAAYTSSLLQCPF